MTLEIFQTRRFKKALQAMYRAGKNERAAAKRAEKIIADLQADPLHAEAKCKRTRYGELRLRNFRKYDLACGFRLIGLKRRASLVFVYIGSHDDCQRWLENNRHSQDGSESEPVPVQEMAVPELHEHDLPVSEGGDEYEEFLMAQSWIMSNLVHFFLV